MRPLVQSVSGLFFQVNPAQAEALYEKVLQLAHLSGEETVLMPIVEWNFSIIFCKKNKKSDRD